MAGYPIVHVEIPLNNPDTDRQFYADLFGWNMSTAEEFNYHMFQPETGPGGGFIKAGTNPGEAVPGGAIIYFGTDDIDATLAKAISLGAQPHIPPMEIPGSGWMTVFIDPSGNKIGLFKFLNH